VRVFAAWLLFVICGAAEAHANGASYLGIDADDDGGRVGAAWDIAAADLELPLALDSDGDGALTADEIEARRAAILAFAMQRLALRRGGAECRLLPGRIARARRASEDFLRLELEGRCARDGRVEVSTALFFGSPSYTALVDARTPNGRFAAVLSMQEASWSEPASVSVAATLPRFVTEGFRHVLIGYDHVAFLLLLLLPGVLRKSGSGWTPATSGRSVVLDLLRIVTAFTIAHSVTLGLAATGIVRLPAQPIEVAIAGSIVIAGLLNLFPAASRFRLRLAFGFGLIHGFGFANALREIGAEGARLAPMLAGFNLGVELAQLAIVALTLPVLWMASRGPRYASGIMPALSIATAVTGAVWFAGRL
jgi:hypothetical protein